MSLYSSDTKGFVQMSKPFSNTKKHAKKHVLDLCCKKILNSSHESNNHSKATQSHSNKYSPKN